MFEGIHPQTIDRASIVSGVIIVTLVIGLGPEACPMIHMRCSLFMCALHSRSKVEMELYHLTVGHEILGPPAILSRHIPTQYRTWLLDFISSDVGSNLDHHSTNG